MTEDDGGASGPGRTPKIEAEVQCPYDGDDREGFKLSVPYSRRFVERLKATVPHEDRRWNPTAKTWWLAAAHLEEAKALVEDAFGGYQLRRPDAPDVYRDGSGDYEQPELF